MSGPTSGYCFTCKRMHLHATTALTMKLPRFQSSDSSTGALTLSQLDLRLFSRDLHPFHDTFARAVRAQVRLIELELRNLPCCQPQRPPDHVVAAIEGGRATPTNTTVLCDTCWTTLSRCVKQYNAFIHTIHEASTTRSEGLFFRACRRMEKPLALLAERPVVVDFCTRPPPSRGFLLLCGAPGTGKSTQLPQYLAECAALESQQARDADGASGEDAPAPRRKQRLVICVEANVVAANVLYERVVAEYEDADVHQLDENGNAYMSKRVTVTDLDITDNLYNDYHILFMTADVLLCYLHNPSFDLAKNVYAILFDDAHERTVERDLLLGLLKEYVAASTETAASPYPLRVVLTVSAAQDLPPFTRYLSNATSVELKAPAHPVSVVYVDTPLASAKRTVFMNSVVQSVIDCLIDQQRAIDGGVMGSGDKRHILVFLPSHKHVADMFECLEQTFDEMLSLREQYLDARARSENTTTTPSEADVKSGVLVDWANVLPCAISNLDKGINNVAYCETDEVVKVVLTSFIAETSVVISGIGYVIDSGFTSRAVYHPKSATVSTVVLPISQRTAQLRADRAAHDGPGKCIRLYTRAEYDAMPTQNPAAVQSAPLFNAMLHLAALGRSAPAFSWMEKPPAGVLEATMSCLLQEQALTLSPTLEISIAPLGEFAVHLPDLSLAHAKVLYFWSHKNDPLALATGVLAVAGMKWLPRSTPDLLSAADEVFDYRPVSGPQLLLNYAANRYLMTLIIVYSGQLIVYSEAPDPQDLISGSDSDQYSDQYSDRDSTSDSDSLGDEGENNDAGKCAKNAEGVNAQDGNAEDGNVEDGNAEDGNVEDGNAEDANAEDGNAGDVGEQHVDLYSLISENSPFSMKTLLVVRRMQDYLFPRVVHIANRLGFYTPSSVIPTPLVRPETVVPHVPALALCLAINCNSLSGPSLSQL